MFHRAGSTAAAPVAIVTVRYKHVTSICSP
jgi:hypothetical protein